MYMEELFNAISEFKLLRVQEILNSDQNFNINQVNELGQNAFHVAANAIKEKKKINLEGITNIELTNPSDPEAMGIMLNAQSIAIASSSTIYCDLEYDLYNVTNGTRVLLRPAYPSASKDIIEIIELLIRKFPDHLNTLDAKGNSPLNLALSSEHIETIKLFIQNGATANLSAKDEYGNTPLHQIILLKDCDITNYFLNQYKKMNVNIGNDQENAPLFFLTDSEFYNKDIFDFLIKNGAKVNNANIFGITALHRATESGNFDMVSALLDNGSDILLVDQNGNTIFHNASSSGNLENLEFLISCAKEHGYNQELIQGLNATNQFGESVIFKAANSSNPAHTLELLIQNGADVDALNQNNKTALHEFLNRGAENTGNIRAVEALLSVGANPNIPDNTGNYPIHLAAKHENFKELCKLLLLAGADVNTTDANGNTLGDLIINRVNQNDEEALVTAGNDAAELYDFAESITVLINDFRNHNCSNGLYDFPFSARYLIYKQIFGSSFPSKSSLQKFLTQNIFTKEDGEAIYNKTLIPKCDDAKILNIPYNILKEELDIFTKDNGVKFLTDLHNNMWKTIALTTKYNTTAKNDVFGNENLVNLILNYVGADVKPHKGLAALKTLIEQYPNNEENFEPKESEITTLTTVHPYEETKECDIPSLGETTNNIQEYLI